MKGIKIVIILVVMAAVFGVGLFMGYQGKTFTTYIPGAEQEVELSEEEVGLLWQAWSILEGKHFAAGNFSNEEIVFSAIEGLADGYEDPYTVFFPPVESEEFSEEISGEFSGVGMEIGISDNDVIVVVAPLKESPAELAGMRTGDLVISIDDESTFGYSTQDAVDKIRGPKGEIVKLTILRDGEEGSLDIEIVRDTIDFPTTDTKIVDDVFVLNLYNFNEKAGRQFDVAYDEFIESGKNKLILDLRQNPGGFLRTSIDIASYFLDRGEIVVKESFGEGSLQGDRDYRSSGSASTLPADLQMAVLIDGGSASASEILAGALSEHKVATLIGTKSFGKGSVQEFIELPKGTSIKVTVAKWFTPFGNAIDKVGLEPDFRVTFDFDKYQEFEFDSQMDAALRHLNGEVIESEILDDLAVSEN